MKVTCLYTGSITRHMNVFRPLTYISLSKPCTACLMAAPGPRTILASSYDISAWFRAHEKEVERGASPSYDAFFSQVSIHSRSGTQSGLGSGQLESPITLRDSCEPPVTYDGFFATLQHSATKDQPSHLNSFGTPFCDPNNENLDPSLSSLCTPESSMHLYQPLLEQTLVNSTNVALPTTKSQPRSTRRSPLALDLKLPCMSSEKKFDTILSILWQTQHSPIDLLLHVRSEEHTSELQSP